MTGSSANHEVLPWREAFRRYVHLDPVTADDAALRAALGAHADAPRDRNEALDLLLGLHIEPHLGQGCWTVLTEYPAAAAAQARLRPDADGNLVAARFEIYRHGLELANGYHELTDAAALRERLEHERRRRTDAARLQLDERFLAAMASGLGDCAGIAVGFDRVVMLALGLDDVGETQAFPNELA